jgi:hypothetical protein
MIAWFSGPADATLPVPEMAIKRAWSPLTGATTGSREPAVSQYT